MRHVISAVFTASFFALGGAAHAQAPQGYPADYAKIVEAAKKEGKVAISSTTDAVAANPLIKDFEALYLGDEAVIELGGIEIGVFDFDTGIERLKISTEGRDGQRARRPFRSRADHRVVSVPRRLLFLPRCTGGCAVRAD